MAKTVIIIDDDADDLEIMGETLRQIDPAIVCISFVFPEEAIKLFKDGLIFCPDFIFVDINMPKITGMECLIELRKIPYLKEIPITIYSTSMRESIAKELIARGATFTMQKPSRIEDYLTILEAIILQTNVPTKYLTARGMIYHR